MKVAEYVKYGFNNISFTVTNKASNIAVCLFIFINLNALLFIIIGIYSSSVVCKGVKFW